MAKMMFNIKKNWRTTLLVLVIIIAIPVLMGAGFVIYQVAQAPDISEIDATPNGYRSTILDKDGEVMENLAVTESNRIYVSLEEIPDDLEHAFVAIEDARFYSHGGIDIKGIIRAGVKGITNGFKFTQGASTITQQLLKNNVFTDWMGEESFMDRLSRKIQEWSLAMQLEDEYSKEWILENYLNTINLGGGTRGVQRAAQYYFGKDVTELSLAQCALIAGITQSPEAHNPLVNPENSVNRQHLVLDAMLDQGWITKEQYDDAMLENVISKLNVDGENKVQIFTWFEDALLGQIVEDLTTEYTYSENDAWNLIYSGGLTIHATVDQELQEDCEDIIKDPSWYVGDEAVSMVMTNAKTGAVEAIVGGRGEKESSLTYNRATDAIRQPGSTVKVIGEYAAALEAEEITLGTAIDDEPYTYSDGTPLKNAYGTFKGMTTVREAIADSSNIVAVKVFQTMGTDTVFEQLKEFGITTLTDEDKNEALSIGGTYNGVTNLEMTGAYNAIANNGYFIEPYFYTQVVDRNGKVILERGKEGEQIIREETAELLTAAMEEVITSGTGTAAAVEGVTLAGKSGTTNDYKDLWFIGFSSHYTCGLWAGHDNYAAQESSAYVKAIWQSLMENAHYSKEDEPIVNAANLVEADICTKCGKLAVSRLCNNTLQGDMTVEELFIAGTEPKKNCDCHVKVKICGETGMEAGDYCPFYDVETDIYLKSATAGTEDEAYVLPESAKSVCDVHTELWDIIIPSGF